MVDEKLAYSELNFHHEFYTILLIFEIFQGEFEGFITTKPNNDCIIHITKQISNAILPKAYMNISAKTGDKWSSFYCQIVLVKFSVQKELSGTEALQRRLQGPCTRYFVIT